MDLMQTVEDSFRLMELLGMRKETDDPFITYRYLSLPQKGGVDVLGNIQRYYYTSLNYHVLKEITLHYKMNEPYVEFGIVEESRNFITVVDEGEETGLSPSGITFMAVRPTGSVGCIYLNRDTYCRGSSMILRHAYCVEHLFPLVHTTWGEDADEYSTIQAAGESCLPDWVDIISGLKRCAYTGHAAQLYLDGKASEALAALSYAIENLDRERIPMFTAYEREAVVRTQNILRSRIKKPPGMQSLSLELGMNPNKIQAAFKYYTGVTVMEYLRSYRMERALELLRSDMLLEEIADEVGYKSASRFSETFHKTYGLLPSKYRKML